MSTTIHHGPPGSFKSFTLVQRFAITALSEGRVVITNIRGLTSIQRIKDQFPDLNFPESSDLIFVNSETAKGRELMAGWFHWVPLRALVIIDEAQRIYPDRRDFKLESLDKRVTPDGYQVEDVKILINDEYTQSSYSVGRPEDVLTAFDMQRHFQWDVHLSTTNVGKIQTRIREVAEYAYRHRTLSGKLPWLKNTWHEVQHDPENSGKLLSNYIGQPRKYTADPRVFRCYQSTATGEHTESKADQSILNDPKLKVFAFVLLCCFGYLFYRLIGYLSADKPADKTAPVSAPTTNPTPQSPANQVAQDPSPDTRINRDHDPVSQAPAVAGDVIAFAFLDLDDTEHTKTALYQLDANNIAQRVDYSDLNREGYVLSVHGYCSASLITPQGQLIHLTCRSPRLPTCTAVVKTPKLYGHYCDPPRPAKQLNPIQDKLQSTPGIVTAAAQSLN